MAIEEDNKRVVNLQEDWSPLALLLILIIAFLYNGLVPLYGTQTLSSPSTDTNSYFFPARSFGFNTLREGVAPLWNPYIYAGTPFIATLQTAVFYPFNFPFLFLSTAAAINWSIALHLFLSGTFTYYLLRYYGTGHFGSTIAGIVYTFSAPQVMHIYAGHLNVLTAMVWTPLMFLFLDRLVRGDGWRYGIYLSLAAAFQLLAGQPQYLFYSLIATSLYLLFLLIQLYIAGSRPLYIGSKVLLFVSTVILGFALSAVQILPTVEMTRYSTRENLSYEWVSIFSFPPENLITFLIPDFFGDMLKVPYWGKNYLWEMSGYVGIMPLILAGIAVFYIRNRIVWFFTGLATVSVVLALGKYTPLLKLLYTVIPGFNLFRGNSKFIFLNALSLAVLSGFGADALSKGFIGQKDRFRTGIAAFTVLSASGLLFIYSALDDVWFREAIGKVMESGDLFNNPESFMRRGFEGLAAATFRSGMLWTIAFLTSGSALLILYSYGKLKDNAFKAFVLSIIIFDLFSFGMRYMVTFDSRETYWDKDVVDFLKQDPEPYRVIAPGVDVNSGMVAGFETLGGYDTIMVKRYSEFINYSQGNPPDRPNLWVNITGINSLTNLLNARYLVLASSQKLTDASYQPVFDNGRFKVYRNHNAMPRAFIVHDAKVVADRDAIFREMADPGFDPAAYAIIEKEPGISLNNRAATSPLPRFIEYSPNRITIEAYLDQPGLLVLGDTYYPGWKAYVDGKETEIYCANYIMRAVALNEGRHRIEFSYDPMSFKIGALISSIVLAGMASFLIWDRWKKRECLNCV